MGLSEFLYKLFKIKKFANIALRGNICNSKVDKTSKVANLAFILNSNIDKYSSIGRYTNVLNADIGKFCSISYFCTIGATPHPKSRITTNAFPYIKDYGIVSQSKRFEQRCSVGNDVYIGTSAVIMPNTKISNGAIIGAGAVVTKDVPPYAIVAGVPAKVIGYRFSDSTIERLEKLQWWDKDKKFLKLNVELFQEDLTDEILDKLEKASTNNETK